MSLFGDIIYEGARSINGPFLKELGSKAFTIGLIVGIAELLGYIIRLLSGYFTDRLRSPWLFMGIGYGMLISVPLMAFAPSWQIAAILLVTERIGKGIRSPAKDTLVSTAAKRIGTGISFGILEAIDQVGATLGPFIFTFVFLFSKNRNLYAYQQGFLILGLFFIILIAIMIHINIIYKRCKLGEIEMEYNNIKNKPLLTGLLRIYLIFMFFTTLGFINFALIGYHVKTNMNIDSYHIPTLYALAMLIDALAGITSGKIYDFINKRFNSQYYGVLLIGLVPFFSFLCIPFLLKNSLIGIYTCAIIWGYVMGTHETIMKAVIVDLTDWNKRATSFGVFHVIYGLSFFLGSAIIGKLSDYSLNLVFLFVLATQLIAIIIYLYLLRKIQSIRIE